MLSLNPLDEYSEGINYPYSLRRRNILILLATFLLLAAVPLTVFFLKEFRKTESRAFTEIVDAPKTAQDQIIVKVRGNALGSFENLNESEKAGKVLSRAAKSGVIRQVKHTLVEAQRSVKENASQAEKLKNIYTIRVDQSQNIRKVYDRLKKDPSFEFVQWNYAYENDMVPNDSRYKDQWAHPKVSAPLAWDLSTGSAAVVIAIIDTGAKLDHEDLAENIWVNSDEIAGNRIDDDRNGYIDDINGWNFSENNNNLSDTNGHGTKVAGVAAAKGNNSKGVAGVCWNCKLMILKRSSSSESVANSIYYAVSNGAKVINMSFGSYDPGVYGPDTLVSSVVDFAYSKNVLLVGTAGNNSTNDKRYPGAYEKVIAVGSTDTNDLRAEFSNWGDWVDVSAPGTSILSTSANGDYASDSGTSFSAPYVAGVAGLLFSRFPSLTLPEAKNIIEYTVNKITTDKPIGSGRLNSQKAIQSSSQPQGPFAIIKNLYPNFMLPSSGSQIIWGTSLGTSTKVEYQAEGSNTWNLISTGGQIINGVLGELNTASLGSSLFFNIRLTSTSGGITDTHVVKVGKNDTNLSGWPKTFSGELITSSVVVADVDRNGDNEVIFGTYRGYVYVVNHDGSLLSGWPKAAAKPFIYGAPALGDIDGDGDLEIVVSSYGSLSSESSVSAWHHTGSVVSGWPKLIPQSTIRGAAVLANLDSDAALEVIAAVADGKGYAWNGNGSLLTGWPVGLPETNIQSSPAFGDVDGNGQSEIIFSTNSYTVVVSASGKILASWQKSGTYQGSPILVNVNSDSGLDIAQPEGNNFVVRNMQGSIIWQKQLVTNPYYGQAAAGDINNDSKPEIAFSSSNSSAGSAGIYLFDYQGNILPGWPKLVQGQDGSFGPPAIGDIDGDGYGDIIAATENGLVYAWKRDGGLIDRFPKLAGGSIPTLSTGTTVSIADVNKDGTTEILIGDWSGNVFAWTLGTSYRPSEYYWMVSRHDNTNLAAFPYVPVQSKGDVNCDGITNSVDSLLILRYIANLTAGSNTCQAGKVYLPNADVHPNGTIDAVDALYILQIIAGIRNPDTLSFNSPYIDSDGDGIANQQEANYSCMNSSLRDATADPDGDTISGKANMDNIHEIALETNPCSSDTDGDGFIDGIEFYIDTKIADNCPETMAINDEITDAWPADLNDDRRVTLADMTSFISPVRRLGARQGDVNYLSRYDLNLDGLIDIVDMTTLTTLRPPMYNGLLAYNGPICDGPADLIIESITASPANPVIGTAVSFSATVRNIGFKTTAASTTRLRVDVGNNGSWDVIPSTRSTGSLSINTTEVETWSSAWTASFGIIRIEVCADVTNSNLELMEINNCREVFVNVGTDLQVTNLQISPTSLVSGNYLSVSATIVNRGTVTSPSTYSKLRIDIGNNGSWDVFGSNQPTGSLAQNAAETETWANAWRAASGNHKVEVCADFYNASREIYEDNNCTSRVITVN